VKITVATPKLEERRWAGTDLTDALRAATWRTAYGPHVSL
jgi:hypothetical protein